MNAADHEAKVVREWLLEVMRRTRLKPTPLAKEAGLSPSTLLRALDPENPSALERRSIKKIVDKFGVQGPPIAEPQSGGSGFAEPELLETPDYPTQFGGLVLEVNQYVKRINTRALELIGYLPGDLVLWDMSLKPVADDIVEAQVFNRVRGITETVPRLFDPPYLVARTADAKVQQKPLLVDDNIVRIMAVARRMIRERQ